MPSTQALKGRIRSVKNTKQITKAMQLVAASKMRKAQEATKLSAPYTEAAREMLTALSHREAVKDHPRFKQRPVQTRLMIVIDSATAGGHLRRETHNLSRHHTAVKDRLTIVIAFGHFGLCLTLDTHKVVRPATHRR